ncbi:pyridoxamine 5'-phosphate oxidase-related FMN-binding [Chloroherpeton thalassium ATCC 35110]|uniref:Pyridoxamine 5'-phosphate oxidase-related FMN-binding n=1 Tax=Chloroherpeton thalassium (strain ATCC 35110 / GB-78) TaxID=517418 RepID=B3QVM3_CHLT3|nr:pyridoxamine 5'-phosphate oxidase family protein [Chloroherpeton thalassium]ACF13080.1 pyridoxamine 5'-phosphate oxidase-related FMN-binding [Chloroherpeton thalassium ATCC 35110]
MSLLTEEMKDLVNNAQVWVLATADLDGIPNAVPVNWCELLDSQTMMLINNCMKKTIENIEQNPKVAVSVWKGVKGFQFKGTARIESSGAFFEEAEQIMRSANPALTPKSVILIDINEVFSMSSGEHASERADG